jgi:hypothetical protein
MGCLHVWHTQAVAEGAGGGSGGGGGEGRGGCGGWRVDLRRPRRNDNIILLSDCYSLTVVQPSVLASSLPFMSMTDLRVLN